MTAPFHASITPQAYATGAATVIAWMLVIMLFITPRTFFVGGVGGKSGLLGRRGMISGAGGGGSITGVGTRPWLQKVAAMTVAISLTLATADTFKIAERQYDEGFMDTNQLRKEVVGGSELKISRVISDIFIWLAQVQTLIRLFPRHKEKVIIKWVGFALILFDITFSCLNNFGPYEDAKSPAQFKTAIPALNYLFQLSLSMLFAAWVMYYAITKRRYAFYHPMMWNIAIVALLSLVAILTPVVFFITDISNESVAGWGDYFRWVGAAAASVIVWEWVERIEALEREERKDGILGREIYDGDEMLETTPYTEVANWPGGQITSRNVDLGKGGPGDYSGGGGLTSGATIGTHTAGGHGLSSLAQRLGRTRVRRDFFHRKDAGASVHLARPAPARKRSEEQHNPHNYSDIRRPPSPIASPVSRTNTTSAGSTVYTIRYHPISNTPPAIRQDGRGHEGLQPTNFSNGAPPGGDLEGGTGKENEPVHNRSRWNWQAMAHPFRRRRASPPPEVQRGRVIEPLVVEDVSTNLPAHNYSRWALKSRLGAFAAEQGEKLRERTSGREEAEANLPVTIIPAHPRGRTWSPELLQQQKQIQAKDRAESGASHQLPSPNDGERTSTSTTQTSTQQTSSSGTNQTNASEHLTGSTVNSPSRIRFTTGAPRSSATSPNQPRPLTVDLGTEQPSTSPASSASVQPDIQQADGRGSKVENSK